MEGGGAGASHAAAEHPCFMYVSSRRSGAAVLDALGRRLTLGEMRALVDRELGWRLPPEAARTLCGATGLVTMDADGRLSIDRKAPDVGAMRMAIRKLSHKILARHAQDRALEATRAECMAASERRKREERRHSAGLRRAILRAVVEPDAPKAIAILDLGERSFRT